MLFIFFAYKNLGGTLQRYGMVAAVKEYRRTDGGRSGDGDPSP